jgi:transcriptional regulator with XRE-family HTH domain
MNDFSLERDAKHLVAEVGCALRMARRRRRLSQREFAQQLGVSKSRLARLESDAGTQSLEMVSQVLMASGFRLEVVAASGALLQEDDGLAATLLALCDATGRRFPAHLEARAVSYPPTYWFVRNGGWLTSKAFPKWTYERRFTPRAAPRRGARDEDRTDECGIGASRGNGS